MSANISIFIVDVHQSNTFVGAKILEYYKTDSNFEGYMIVMRHLGRILYLFATLFLTGLLFGCSMTKVIPEGESMLIANKIEYDGKKPSSLEDLPKYIKQTPKKGIFGWHPAVALYNSGNGSGKGWDKLAKKIGIAPLIYDSELVSSSEKNMLTHIRYMGFYNSKVTSQATTENKKTKVVYYVTPGVNYTIDNISVAAPDSTQTAILESEIKKGEIKSGNILSEYMLEAESERLAQQYRNRGYYGFDKSYFFFTADTLSHNRKANLHIQINDYTRNEDESSARPHKLYNFGPITVSARRTYPQRSGRIAMENDSASVARRDSLLSVWRATTDTAKFEDIYIVQVGSIKPFLRKKVLNRLNLIKEGTLYDERVVKATYSRFSSLPLFSSVNIQQIERDSLKVGTDISLQASSLQGYKLNLQGSTNSNALFGISPAISYYHKNLFNGAEVLTVGLMGDFQFKFNSNVRSTELGVSASLDFPRFMLAPDRWFRSGTLPHTILNFSYNFQTRPEYTRNIISANYGYTWSLKNRWFFKVSPLQANIVKVYNLDSLFYKQLSDPFLRNSYKNHFDVGVGANIYFTTDASSNPLSSYFYFRYALDLSGNLLSLFNNAFKQNQLGEYLIWGSPYSQYFKTELSAVYTFKFGNNPNHMLAIRGLGGVGKGYGNSNVLPFEKMFWGGGAYSIRGWQPRTLGPGYAPRDSAFRIANQTGDIRLEGNIEYRFPMFWLLNGALFADIGNIWTFDRGKDPITGAVADERGVFKLSNFYKHLALGTGVGLRLDISFAIIRLDLGFKTYNPVEAKWIGPGKWFKNGNYELNFGIGYPF